MFCLRIEDQKRNQDDGRDDDVWRFVSSSILWPLKSGLGILSLGLTEIKDCVILHLKESALKDSSDRNDRRRC